LSHIHHTPVEDHPTKVAIMWFSHLVVVNTQKKNSGITHPKNEQNGLGWDNGFGPTPSLQFSSQLWGILKANSHQTSSNPQIPKRNPGLVLDLQYLFFLGCQFLGNPSDWGTSSCSQVANAPIVVEPLFIWPSQSSGRAILGMERAQPIASNVGNKDPGRPETTGRKLAMCIEPAIMGV
jgi:hypothetical protein